MKHKKKTVDRFKWIPEGKNIADIIRRLRYHGKDENGEFIKTKQPNNVDHFDIDYTLLDKRVHNTLGNYIQLLSGRGCSYRCTFCYVSITSRKWRGFTDGFFSELKKKSSLLFCQKSSSWRASYLKKSEIFPRRPSGGDFPCYSFIFCVSKNFLKTSKIFLKRTSKKVRKRKTID